MTPGQEALDVPSREVEPATAETPTVADLTPALREQTALMRPAAPVGDVHAAFLEYEELKAKIIEPSDRQKAGAKTFTTRSGWRKLTVAFGVSNAIVDRTIHRDADGRVVGAEFVVRATAPNGRSMDGWGNCDVYERCDEHFPNCPEGCKKHCGGFPAGCSGRKHFTKPEHDIPATAETRAKNRAAADLFGMGEVSAEEIDRRDPTTAMASADDYTAVVEAARRALADGVANAAIRKGGIPVVLGVPLGVMETDPATDETYEAIAITKAQATDLIARLDEARAMAKADHKLDGAADDPGAGTENDGPEAAAPAPPVGAVPEPEPGPVDSPQETEAPAEEDAAARPASQVSAPDSAARTGDGEPRGPEPVTDPAPASGTTSPAPAAGPPATPDYVEEPKRDPIRKGQANRMGALCSELGITADDRRRLCSFIAQRTITSATSDPEKAQLTHTEGEWILSALRAIQGAHIALRVDDAEVYGCWLEALDPSDGLVPPDELLGVKFLRDFAAFRGLTFTTEEDTP